MISTSKNFWLSQSKLLLSLDTFDHLENWIESTLESADPEAILILIGNKVDLAFQYILFTKKG